jgi:hypothetical protein
MAKYRSLRPMILSFQSKLRNSAYNTLLYPLEHVSVAPRRLLNEIEAGLEKNT